MRANGVLAFLSWIVCVAANHRPVHSATGRNFTLTLSWGYAKPDCVERDPVVFINGQFPGPTLRLKVNELVTFTIVNHIEGIATTMHWHGIDQVGTPWADGAASSSECPIGVGQQRSYTFRAPSHPGTHYYHGHIGVAKDAGAYGILLVDPLDGQTWPGDMQHDVDYPVLLADWYHAPSLTLASGLLVPDFRWAGDPQSVLINGKGHFNCSDNVLYSCVDEVCSNVGNTLATAYQKPYYLVDQQHVQCRPEDCPGLSEFSFAPGKKYMFRFVNGGALSFLNVALENHTMHVVELDGEPVKPRLVSSLDLHAGQRAAVIVEANQPADAYWMSVKTRGRKNVRFGSAIISYVGSLRAPSESNLLQLQSTHPGWDDVNFTLLQQRGFEHPNVEIPPNISEVAERIVLLGTQERFAPGEYQHIPNATTAGINLIGEGNERPENHCTSDGTHLLKWAVARVTHKPATTPVLHSLYYGTPSLRDLTRDNGYFRLEKGKVYDVVLQNYPACNGACETHPWHLHGHHFWVVGTWPGEFNGTLPAQGSGGSMYRRDTIMVIGEGHEHKPVHRRGCGFTVIRFKADNPGAWPFHCHAEFHQMMGMGITFYYPPQTIPAPDRLDYHAICGDVTVEVAAKKLQQQLLPSSCHPLARVALALFLVLYLMHSGLSH